jgi:hypothetical protein
MTQSYNTANQAVVSLQPTCISLALSNNNVPDWQERNASNLTASYRPDAVMQTYQIGYGVHNPSSLAITSNWIMDTHLGAFIPSRGISGVVLTDHQPFTISPGTARLLTFNFPLNTTVAVRLLNEQPIVAQYGVSTPLAFRLTRDDSALGYHFTSHDRNWPSFSDLGLNSTGWIARSC